MYLYPAIFELNNNQYNVFFPDLPGCLTFGNSMEEAITMAVDALEGYLIILEDDNDEIPSPTDPLDLRPKKHQFISLISANTSLARKKEEAKLVKKTLTIPSYLNQLANEEGINFSQTLTDALKEKLGS